MRPLITISGRIFFFFFNDTATTEIYTLSLHDALPISVCHALPRGEGSPGGARGGGRGTGRRRAPRSEEHTSELQSQSNLVCRLLLEKKKMTATLPDVFTRSVTLRVLRAVLRPPSTGVS